MAKTTGQRHELHPFSGTILALLLGAATLPFIFSIPLWVTSSAILILSLRVYGDRRGWPLPGRLLRYSLVALFGFFVFQEFQTLAGHESSTCLLILLGALKLMETVRIRDVYIVVMVVWLLGACLQLFEQSAAHLGLGVFLILFGSVALKLLQDPRRIQLRLGEESRGVLRLFLIGLPLGVLIFFVFPRFSVRTFGLNMQPPVTTGFSDSVDPGSVADLARTEETVMRVEFSGSKPNYAALYFRGAVLDWSEGLRWSRKNSSSVRAPIQISPQSVVQTITLEPQTGAWAFGLDYPLQVEGTGFWVDSDQLVRAVGSYNTRRILKVASGPRPKAETTLTREEYQRWTQLPEVRSWPRTEQLAEEFLQRWRTPEEAAAGIHQYFVEGGFRYTLQPGVIVGDNVDAFLFETRKGFCEHFSATQAVLLRLMGIPARVVTGFHGGEFNSVGNFLQIRTRDAHAWVEFFVPGKGWLRSDPVREVAHERFELGATQYFQERQELAQELGTLFGAVSENSVFARSWLALRGFVESMDYEFTHFLLNYNLEWQKKWLEDRGWGEVSTWLVVLGALFLLLVAFFVTRWWILRQAKPRDPLGELMERARKELVAMGLQVQPHEGPATLQRRITAEQPEAATHWVPWLRSWEMARYGPNPSDLDKTLRRGLPPRPAKRNR